MILAIVFLFLLKKHFTFFLYLQYKSWTASKPLYRKKHVCFLEILQTIFVHIWLLLTKLLAFIVYVKHFIKVFSIWETVFNVSCFLDSYLQSN